MKQWGRGGVRPASPTRLLRCLAFLLWVAAASAEALDPAGIPLLRPDAAALPPGERIAFWAEAFLGTPYDDDPAGLYVSRSAVVADDRVDCMYLVFRAVELGLSSTAGEALAVALDKRFLLKGEFKDGRVTDYRGRFRFGEDMVLSGKWGSEVTPSLGTPRLAGIPRTGKSLAFVSAADLRRHREALRTGDIVFFVNARRHRPTGAVVGHMGIVKREKQEDLAKEDVVFLIHARGTKGRGGAVVKVPLAEYLASAPFRGAAVTRFD